MKAAKEELEAAIADLIEALEALGADVSDLEGVVDGANGDIADLADIIADLEARLAVLEEDGCNSVIVSGGIGVIAVIVAAAFVCTRKEN